jgi:hypothetical protein
MTMTMSEGRWFRGDGEESPSLGLLGANTDCVATSRNSPGLMTLGQIWLKMWGKRREKNTVRRLHRFQDSAME